jgi:hypothetical protein
MPQNRREAGELGQTRRKYLSVKTIKGGDNANRENKI